MKQTPIQTAEQELVMRQTAAKHLPVGSIVARQNQTAIDTYGTAKLAPFEDRLTSSVSKQLGTTAQFHHWIKKPTGDVPVFAVPNSAIAKAKDLGLTVVELMMNQNKRTEP